MADGCGMSMRDDQDLQEEDVWAVVKEREDSSSQEMRRACKDSSGRHFLGAPRVIPRRCHEPTMSHQSSAPVKIPDWSKIYGKTAKKGVCSDSSGDDHHENFWEHHDSVDAEEEDDDDDDDGMVPPHEYIARRLARTQISSFSMCEGIGRTLKGRDLSKVRNAILTKTGFLE